MEGLKAPGELSLEGNVSDNWRKWRRSLENYLLAMDLVLQPRTNDTEPAANAAINRRQVAILLNQAGEEACEIYGQFEFAEEESNQVLADVVSKFEDYCNPRRNMLYEWYVFWSLIQGEGEPIDSFLKRLRTQAAKCDFGVLKEQMLLCRIVFGLTEVKLKERLLRDRNINLQNALDDIRAVEITKQQMTRMADGDRSTIGAVHSDSTAGLPKKTQYQSTSAKNFHRKEKTECKYCGYIHAKGRCPAYGENCKKCGLKNHFERVCRSNKVQSVESTELEHQLDSLFIGAVDVVANRSRQSWILPMRVTNAGCSTDVSFKIDTGAETNCIDLNTAKSLLADLKPTKVHLYGYNKAKIRNVAAVQLAVEHKGQSQMVHFEVIEEDLSPILGLEAAETFGLISRVNEVSTSILDEYPKVFEGIGKLEGKHEICIDQSVKPVIHYPRRVPLSMMDRVKTELDNMEASGIITKVEKPTDWVSSMVCVEKKNGSIRICLDPKDLNKAVKREHHRIPTLEDIAFRFSGMQYYTIMDMKHGFWHIALTEKSSLLTTFNTPFGRYSFKRLPFGLHSSPEVFEKKVEQLFGDLPGVSVYFDDIIVAGKTQQEHDSNLRKLLAKAQEKNVKFNKEKIQLNKTEVRYLGHIVSKDGLRPDPEKVAAIKDMPDPTDKEGVQRLIGTLNFLRSYIPNMSACTEPLRALLRHNSQWVWSKEQIESFETIKRLLTSQPVLQYFDVTKDAHLQVDASKRGLGAVLLQDSKPVAYASRSLTETECNYPQIDKELLAVVFGCERFHNYLYGRAVHIQTDHKPLVPIMGKPLCKISPRLQRLILRLQRYDIAQITYVPGKYMYIADTLSRAYLQRVTDDQADLESEVVMIHTLETDEISMARMTSAYAGDPAMADLMKAVHDGWNWCQKSEAPTSVQPYWSKKADIYEHDGFLYAENRLIIPHSERRHLLKMLHMGHLGIQKCRERARKSFYWPGISTDIHNEVSSCLSCARFSNRQQKEPLLPHDVPDLPWNKVAMDIMEYKSNSYLVVVDCYSHFPELRLIRKKTADDVILALKSIFSVHGIPVTIIADNMPFNSQAMLKFATEWCFTVVTSSPHYPKSNGMAERYVQTMKRFLKKCEETGDDIYRSLLLYRESPVTGCTFSPAEMLFNRSIRSNLPITTEMLRPSVVEPMPQLTANQKSRSYYYDRRAKLLPELQPGSRALIRTDSENEWSQGLIVNHHGAPRSYLVDNGQSVVRRNRVHLKPDRTMNAGDDRLVTHPDPVDVATPSVKSPVPYRAPPESVPLSTPHRDAVIPATERQLRTVPPTPPRDTVIPATKRQLRTNRKVPVRFKDYHME
jgi:hypothetical protein